MLRIFTLAVWIGKAFVSVLLLPFDLLRLTILLFVLTFRFITRKYGHFLSGLSKCPPISLEFLASRPNPTDMVWDDYLRYVVRRPLTLRMLAWFCGQKQISLSKASLYKEVKCLVQLTPRNYLRLVASVGLSWLLLAGGGWVVWQTAVRIPRHRDQASVFQRDADRLLAQGSLEKARLQYLNAIQLQPKKMEAQWGLAQCAIGLNLQPEARRALEQVISLDKSNLQARTLLVDLLLRQGNMAQALEHAGWVVERAPANVDARVRLGICQQRLGRRREARQQADAALELSPGHSGALLLAAALAADNGDCAMARSYLARIGPEVVDVGFDRLAMARIMGRCGDYGQAVSQLDQLLARSPDNMAAALERAEMQIILGEIDAAIGNYRRLSEFASANAGIQMRFAELLLASGRLDEAHQVGESMIQTVALRSAGHIVLAMVYYLKGLWIAGAEHCQKHLELKPDSVPGRILLARILMRRGDYRKAVSVLQSLAREGRQNLDSQIMLAECLVEVGNFRAAVDLLRQIQKTHPTSDQPYLLLTRVHLASGQRDKAEEACRKAVELNPKQPVALNNLAILLASRDSASPQELQEAMTLAAEAWKLRPDNPEIADTLGWLHAQHGDYLPAVSLLNYAVRLLPKQPHVYYHLAYALAGLGQWDDAAQTLALSAEISPDQARGPEFDELRKRIEAAQAKRLVAP